MTSDSKKLEAQALTASEKETKSYQLYTEIRYCDCSDFNGCRVVRYITEFLITN